MSDRPPGVSALVCPSVLDVPTSDASPGEEDNPAHGELSEVALRVYYLNGRGQERQAVLTMNDPLEALLGQEERLRHLVYDACARLGYGVLSLQLELRMPRHEERPTATVLSFPGTGPA